MTTTSNNNHPIDDGTPPPTESSWTTQWKSNVSHYVKKSLAFTSIASIIFYGHDLYRHKRREAFLVAEEVKTTIAATHRPPFHQTRLFRTINLAANLTSMSILYFSCQQYLKMRHNCHAQNVLDGKQEKEQEEQAVEEMKLLRVHKEEEKQRLMQHGTAGFLTGTVMYTLLKPNRVVHAWKLGLLFAVGATATVKAHDQFTWWKFNRLVRLEQEEQRIAANSSEIDGGGEEESHLTWFDRVYERLPEWLRKEDEDTAEIRQRYEDIRVAREHIKRLAEMEQEQFYKQKKEQEQQGK